MFMAVYRFVPHVPLRLADVWPGALLGGVLFVLLSQAFPLYFRLLGGTYAVYQTLGLFLILMTWFYCLALILVLGAELNAFRCGHGGAAGTDLAAVQVLMAAPARATPRHHRCGRCRTGRCGGARGRRWGPARTCDRRTRRRPGGG